MSGLRTRLTGGARKALLASVAIVMGVALVPVGARANTVTYFGPDYTPSPLAIRSVTEGHAGHFALKAVITTYGRWPSGLLTGPNFFSMAVQAQLVQEKPNTAPTITQDFGTAPTNYVIINYSGGTLKAVVTDKDLNPTGLAVVRRPNQSTVTVIISKALLGQDLLTSTFLTGYEWQVESSYRGKTVCRSICRDILPRQASFPGSKTELHDVQCPLVTPDPSTLVGQPKNFGPALSTMESLTTTYPIGPWHLQDFGGGKVAFAQLQRTTFGKHSWSIIYTIHFAGSFHALTTGFEGREYLWRVVRGDTQNNRCSRPNMPVIIPLDDSNKALSSDYSAGWSKVGAVPKAFENTLHVSGTPASTFTYTFTGTGVAWIGPKEPTGSKATVTVDASVYTNVSLDGTSPQCPDSSGTNMAGNQSSDQRKTLFCVDGLASGPHTITISVVSGTVGVDGIAVER